MNKQNVLKIINPYLIVLFMILIIGIALRTYRLTEWMPWEPDVGRDMVVVRRLLSEHGPYTVQVTSGSATRFVINSPFYYWITSGLYVITNSPYGIVIVYALWNSMGILFSYYIGKISGDRLLGLLYAALVSCSYILVTLSQKIWQQSILPTLTITSLMLVQLTIAKTNVFWTLALINVSFLGMHFHYSYYPILVVNTCWIVLATGRLLKKQFWYGLICIINYLFHMYIWLSIVNPNNNINHASWAEWILKENSIGHYFEQIRSIVQTISSMTFFGQDHNLSLTIVTATFICLIYYVSREIHIQSLSKTILIYLCTVFLLGVYPEPFNFGRLMIYYPLTLFGLGIVIRRMSLRSCWIFILLAGYIFHMSSSASMSYLTNTPSNQLIKTELLTHFIYQDYLQSCGKICPQFPSFRIYSIENVWEESDWYTGQYWYFLETFTGKKLVSLVNTGNNLEPLIDDPEVRYLICPMLDRNIDHVKKLCLSEYLKRYSHLVNTTYSRIILPTEELNSLYVLYKWVK
jgi:hypothetical protein